MALRRRGPGFCRAPFRGDRSQYGGSDKAQVDLRPQPPPFQATLELGGPKGAAGQASNLLLDVRAKRRRSTALARSHHLKSTALLHAKAPHR